MGVRKGRTPGKLVWSKMSSTTRLLHFTTVVRAEKCGKCRERKKKVEERENEEGKYKDRDFWMSIKNFPFKGYSLTLPSLVSFAAKTLKGEETNNCKKVQRKTTRTVQPLLICFSQLSRI